MPRNEGFGEDSGRRKATVGNQEQCTEKEKPLPLRQERKSDKSDIIKGITLGKSETSEGDEVTEMIFKQKSDTPKDVAVSCLYLCGINKSSKLDSRQFSAEVFDSRLNLVNRPLRRLPIAAYIMAQLLLINTGDALKPCEGESICVILKE